MHAARAARIEIGTRLTVSPPRIDAALDDPAWCAAPPVTDFVQSRPSPGALATLPSVARVLYDDDALYVALRLFDPHPDSIVAPFPRRDDETTSDWVFVEIDSRFDRRSGLSFGLNPRGVQVDGSWWDDVNYDAAWNGVWESAAAIDSLGWTAEYRIPFSQLPLARSDAGAPLVWGINFYRTTPHRGETSNWSPRLPTVVGVVSHFNQLRGLTVPPGHGTLELVPYVAVGGRELTATGGGDLRFRPTRRTSVALSLHPDFGQVEADPSQVNLTTFETFLPEQRPLFAEDAEAFHFTTALAFSSRDASFDQESPFYSRRIGHASSLLGATRVSARAADGWSGALLHAWTGAAGAEPLTSFTVVRGRRAFDDGRSALGLLGTFVDRLRPDGAVDTTLATTALVLGAEGRARFARDRYEVSAYTLASRVGGSPAAIAGIRRQPRHGYALADTMLGALGGISAQARIARIEGRLRWGLVARLVGRGFETNDVGFQRNADWMLAAASWTYQVFRPGHFIRRWSVASSQMGLGWTMAGERRAGVANLTVAADLRDYWGGSLSVDHDFPAADPAFLRGGPPLLRPVRDRWALAAYTDTRRNWQVTLDLAGMREPATGSVGTTVSPALSVFVTDRLQLGLTPSAGFTREGWQYVAQPRDSGGHVHYVLGELHQTTASLTTRATYAFSSHLTLQLYGQMFLGGGHYDKFKEVTAPRAARPADRVTALPSSAPFAFAGPDFSDRELHLNLLFRWEFLPGSTLFLVWTQTRADRMVRAFDIGRDLGRLWSAPADDAVLLKVSYWMKR